MKKFILMFIVCNFFAVSNANAKDEYIEEVRALGAVAGQGIACGAKKYKTFEMLARSILITKANSNEEQERGMYVYNAEKANTYVSKEFDGFDNCKNIAKRFDKQEIFKLTLYHDGTIKMPDGEVFTPRQPYDVNYVYDKNSDDKGEIEAIYNAKNDKKTVKVVAKDITSKQTIRQSYVEQESSVGKISRPKGR